MSIARVILRILAERSARNLTLDELANRLQRSGGKVARRMRTASDRDWNREAAAHITGIERWGQHRLETALGKPLIMDEYDSYRPDSSRAMSELVAAFEATRAETLALVRRLQQASVSPTMTVAHNELGDLSVRGWLAYLNSHASRESIRIR
jgi:hypothetical protein